jgi:chitin disaccharide deacetylase
MRYLIVNGDDFGADAGINRGILEAHRGGILTSASLMVDMPGAEHAASLAREAPELSVGLHVDLPGADADPDHAAVERWRTEIRRQVTRFRELLGHLPTHIDSHHNVHRRPALQPLFVELASSHALPLREHSEARYFSSFYGQWGGETHFEQISVEALARMLREELGEGVTELACHPGYVDAGFRSGYSAEREAELRTLCDPAIRATIQALGLHLIGFRDLLRVTALDRR